MLRIRFGNGLILGGTDYKIQSPIAGLDTPAIRNGNSVYSAVDGGFVVSQYYGFRTIVVKGFFHGGCPEETDELRKNLLDKVYIRYYMPIVIEDLDDKYWFTQGYITDVKMDITSPSIGEYQITILCPDPIIYPTDSLLSDTPTIISTNLLVNSNKTVLRQGETDAYPVFTLTGQFTNPVLTINDKSFALSLTTSVGDITTIDMKSRRVYDINGESLVGDRTTDSIWLYLENGENIVSLTTDSNADSGTATMVYSAGYRGI